MSDQAAFAAALVDPALPCPPGLLAWNGSDPARRFAVYRNNVVVSLIDALADGFPVTGELVGNEFFRAMARLFVLARPPASAMMVDYGSDFPDFIAGFAPAASLPYLADLARLERCRVVAYHAADSAPLDIARIAAALADPAALPGLRLTLHPSLHALSSSYAVVSLWAAHQGVGELSDVVTDRPESALILRCGLAVEITRIPAAAAAFVACLQAGQRLELAMAAATALDAGFDPTLILATLIDKGAVIALNPEGEQK
jgi:hypothetical protein